MAHPDLASFLRQKPPALAKGPVAIILVEDLIEVESTIAHHLTAGFGAVVVLAPDSLILPDDLAAMVLRVSFDAHADNALPSAVNAVNAAVPPGTWLYYCYNAEYLFYPFSETRTVGEMLAFHAEERRDAMLTYVIDLYADDLQDFPDAVSLDRAHLDKSGYYALARNDPDNHNHPRERQLDFFGGLRWRYEEHIPAPRRNIDRIALFRAKPVGEICL